MRVRTLSWAEIDLLVDGLAARLPSGSRCWGVPRGGSVVAAMLRSRHGVSITAHWAEATIAVDDLIDSGRTARMVRDKYRLELEPLIVKDNADWIVFPWEGAELAEDAENTVVRMLQQIGEDPNRPELEDTPRRVVECWNGLFSGYRYTVNDAALERSWLHPEATVKDGAVVWPGISFVSSCEMHLLPFFGVARISYLPRNPAQGKGLPVEVGRLVEGFASRLQTPERLAQQICDALEAHTRGAAVQLEGSSLCPMALGKLDGPSAVAALARSGEFRNGHRNRAGR